MGWLKDRRDRKEMESAQLEQYRRTKDHADAEALRNFCDNLDRDNRNARNHTSNTSKRHTYGPNCMFKDANRTGHGRALIRELEDSAEHRYRSKY